MITGFIIINEIVIILNIKIEKGGKPARISIIRFWLIVSEFFIDLKMLLEYVFMKDMKRYKIFSK
jgi:hypothetical protein